jgi:isoleucyl-tRNA synthetase
VDGFVYDENNTTAIAERTELDRWVLSKLNSLIQEVTAAYAEYEPTQAGRAIESFVDLHLSNWFVRQSRKRFWKGDLSQGDLAQDKLFAYQTLFECLNTVAQLMSPIAPFFADWLYKNLTDSLRGSAENTVAKNSKFYHDSVHLTHLQAANEAAIDKNLEQRMDYAQRISSLALSLRKLEKMRVRQPLSRILLPVLDTDFQAQVDAVKELILQEVNVKKLDYITDTSGVVSKKVKPNFKVLGKKLGKNMAFAKTTLENLTQDEIARFEAEKIYFLETETEKIDVLLAEVEILSDHIPGWSVATDGNLTVALDVTLTDELVAEGNARELVNRIQNLRKTSDFNITDTIKVEVQQHRFLDNAVATFSDYIKSETLATDLLYLEKITTGELIDLADDVQVLIAIRRN